MFIDDIDGGLIAQIKHLLRRLLLGGAVASVGYSPIATAVRPGTLQERYKA